MEEAGVKELSVLPSPDYDGFTISLVAKFMKERIVLTDLHPLTTILEVKEMLQERTRILVKRQKLVGLLAQEGGAKGVIDTLTLNKLKLKSNTTSHQFILMGTPEEHIFVDPSDRDEMTDVIDDFELDFNAGSDEWVNHVANGVKLAQFTEETAVHIMNPPRGKPLLVLDLDRTLLDFSSRQLMENGATPGSMKRPFMDQFLTSCYQLYDMVVWSHTSWRWLETKLIELGMLTNRYKFLFVLDKTSMFTIKSVKRDGSSVVHHVKPLQLIWSKFPQYGSHNTIHIDDLAHNFALNLKSGLKCRAYIRKKKSARRDTELLGLTRYLDILANAKIRFDAIEHSAWEDVVSGKRPLLKKGEEETRAATK